MNPSVNNYNSSVRVGNWNEDIQLEQDRLKSFLDKRDRGELKIQITSKFISAMRKKVDLSVSQDYALHIGDRVVIKCPGSGAGSKPSPVISEASHPVPRPDCVVAVHVTDPSDLERKRRARGAGLVAAASLDVQPNQRTVFCLESVAGGMKGSKVRHGDPFYLSTVSPDIGKLYLCSDRAAFNRWCPKSRHQEAFFMSQPTFLAQWMVQHTNPRLRLEYEHFPVEANEQCVLVHCKTNRCLAVEQDFVSYTPFGSEFELSAHTYLDSHRVEKDNNRWILVVGVPGSSVEPVPRQATLSDRR